MNLRRIFKDLRHFLGSHSVVIFGLRGDGKPTWGTGILVDFRDTPLVLTCSHVLKPIVDTAFVTTARMSYQAVPIYSRRLEDPQLDVGCLVLRDRMLGAEKRFIRAADAVLEDIELDCGVTAYGFPIGHPKVQVGGQIDPGASTARFRSMTVPSVTALPTENRKLGRKQPRIDCTDLRDLKSFEPLRATFTAEQWGGLSGGPVVLTGSRRLVGQITHATAYTLWYNPISEVFRALDGLL